jgi:6-phosphogluconolactonase (cycloisomerase 2 family)
MSEYLSSLGISINRTKSYAAAAAIMTGLLIASPGASAAGQEDEHNQGDHQTFSEFAYTVNSQYGTNFSGYQINIFTGKLTALPGSPYAPGSYLPKYAVLSGIAIDTKDRFLYSSAVGGESLPPDVFLGFSIGANGALTPLPTVAGLGTFQSLAVDPSNRFLYGSGGFEAGVAGYSINAATGLLTPVPGSPFDVGTTTTQLILDPTGKFVYVEDFFPSTLLGFKISPATGTLTPIPGSPFPGVYGPVTVDPTGRFLYAFEQNFSTGDLNINEYFINNRTGAVTLSPHSPFSAPAGVAEAVVDPSGRFLYVAVNLLTDGQGSNEIVEFCIDPVNGSLTPLPSSPVPLATRSTGLTVDPSGGFVYVTLDDSTIKGYSIDQRNGALRALPGPALPTGTGPTGLVVGAFIHR